MWTAKRWTGPALAAVSCLLMCWAAQAQPIEGIVRVMTSSGTQAGATGLAGVVVSNGHTVTLTGLQPGTRYHYRLLTNGVQVQAASASVYFTTLRAPDDPADVFFTVIGDWGQNSSGEQDVASLQDGDDPPMIVTVGDNAYQNGTLSDWDNNALPDYANVMRRALFMPALGNHDLNSVGVNNWANSAEIRLFVLPRNAPPGQAERYFSWDSGDAHFVVLDSNVPGDATQRSWLENDLATTPRKWKFVFLHHTPYSCASGLAAIGSSLTVRQEWGPLFEQYQVDVVFTGHDHLWERSKLMDEFVAGGAPGEDGLGTTYVMTGGGGATLDGDANFDVNGPYRQPLFGSREDCYWLQNGCSGGAGPWCSFSRYQYASARILNNDTLSSCRASTATT